MFIVLSDDEDLACAKVFGEQQYTDGDEDVPRNTVMIYNNIQRKKATCEKYKHSQNCNNLEACNHKSVLNSKGIHFWFYETITQIARINHLLVRMFSTCKFVKSISDYFDDRYITVPGHL